MLSTIELLDLAKHRQGDVTDYRIAKLLGITSAHVTHYRSKGVKPSNPVAMRLAELAGVDPAEAVLAVNLERATSPEDREVWEMLLSRMSKPGKAKTAH
ncbi:hypothetical protein ACS5PN_03900 [Roseateles sp. NT4]|uniref:hypothetical protein n=1 Tax=Roseateles sp. NT4 TaxID=3453715 RepID=UPI003EEC996F